MKRRRISVGACAALVTLAAGAAGVAETASALPTMPAAPVGSLAAGTEEQSKTSAELMDSSDEMAAAALAPQVGVSEERMKQLLAAQASLHLVPTNLDPGFVELHPRYTADGVVVQYLTTSSAVDGAVVSAFDRLVDVSIKVVRVPHSIAELNDAFDRVARTTPIQGDARLLPEDGAIRYVTSKPLDEATIDQARDAAAPVEVRFEVGETARPFYGGGGAFTNTNCTGGFSVKKIGTTTTGLSTAGHCTASGGYFNYAGYTLSGGGVAYDTNADLRWMSNQAAVNFTASVWTGGPSNWPVRSRKNWDNAYVNDPVCWYGKTTQGACGLLLTKYQTAAFPGANPAFGAISVTPSEQGDIGDSGGPVYYSSTAWGIVGGGNSSYTYFTPQYRLETRLGVQVRIQ